MVEAPKNDNVAAKVSNGLLIAFSVIMLPLWFGVIQFIRWTPTQEDKNEMSETAGLCKFQDACSDYPEIRNVCATAGSFDKCMEIKTGSHEKHEYLKRYCSNEGKVMMDQAKIPGFVSCWAAKVNGY